MKRLSKVSERRLQRCSIVVNGISNQNKENDQGTQCKNFRWITKVVVYLNEKMTFTRCRSSECWKFWCWRSKSKCWKIWCQVICVLFFKVFIKNEGFTVLTTHSQESNTFSVDGVARQTWCILSKNDNFQKFSFFSEVYDGDIFEISEPKTEPLHLPIPWGPASKSEKSMFFGPASLNIIQNFIFSQALDWTRWPVGRFRHT